MSVDSDQLVDTFWKHFIYRTDTYAVQNEDGTYTRVGKPNTEWVRTKLNLPQNMTKGVVRRHLEGG
ncbi:MAG: hypothetical protein OEZ48_00485, partial [Candidatus Bathyarchaeota archaeon]|nr:hypothetical protein [Candidatus Bathyarchaeota archaeon]